jgi:predicted aspartyl protease
VQGTGGSIPSRIVSGVTLDVGSLRLTGLTVFVMDMSPVARAIGHDVPVVLGRDALKASVVTFDFPNRAIRFADAKGYQAPAGAIRLQVADDGHQFWTPISVAGLPPVDAQIDLGNGGTIALAKDYWSAQPAIAGLRYAHSQTGGVGGMKAARRVMLSDVSFAGVRYTDVPATLNDDSATLPARGGNIGIELLKPFVVTFDVAGNAVYLEGSRSVPALTHERLGVRTEFGGDRLNVAFVSPEGPGAAAGLKPGDAIVAVDGVKVDPSYLDRPDWTRGPVGQGHTLTLANGREAKVTLADYF